MTTLPPEHAQLFLAPAKLNLDLRIIGRLADGYHLLESVFTLINLCDRIWLNPNQQGNISLHTEVDHVQSADNLCVRAAQLLKNHNHISQGVDIWLEKHIPIGAGLGGGSADAAVVLMALNRLWSCGLSREFLLELGLQLGADVPFFIFGQSAFVRGIGEQLQAIVVPKLWYVIVKPPIEVSTAAVFAHKDLTRNSEPSIMTTFETSRCCRNDMQRVVLYEYPEVKIAFDTLAKYGKPMLTGSGSCVFLRFDNHASAEDVYQKVSRNHQAYCVEGLNRHPFYI